MWIVMTASKSMPSSCIAHYTRVALVEITPEYAEQGLKPKMISERARGVLQLVDLGYYPSAGKTLRSGLQRTLSEARRRAVELNGRAA